LYDEAPLVAAKHRAACEDAGKVGRHLLVHAVDVVKHPRLEEREVRDDSVSIIRLWVQPGDEDGGAELMTHEIGGDGQRAMKATTTRE
jgi:hypothetical protein